MYMLIPGFDRSEVEKIAWSPLAPSLDAFHTSWPSCFLLGRFRGLKKLSGRVQYL